MGDHECPGCPRTIPPHLVACPSCWARLPKRLRQRVTAAFRVSDLNPGRYLQLRSEAQHWFADHPPRGTRAVHLSLNRPNH